YSYLIKPNISDRIRSLVLPQVAQAPIVQSSGPINLPFTSQDGEVSSTINVGGIPSNQIIQSISVNLSITDNRDGDLTIVLVSPNGDQSTLYQNGNDNGQNFTNTTFTDGASSIFGGVAPY